MLIARQPVYSNDRGCSTCAGGGGRYQARYPIAANGGLRWVSAHVLALAKVGVRTIAMSLLVLGNASAANQRVALVIGNAAYEHVPPLANPRNDAEDMAGLLRRLGFAVTEGFDLTDAAMKDRELAFAPRAKVAEVALLFYAGHGMQVDGVNYLLPVDAQLKDEEALDYEAVPLARVLRRMGTGTNLVFLDACRDNPFARGWAGTTRSLGRGLERVEWASASGMFIAFATDPENIAADGEGRNSPFTAALKHHIETPGLEVNSLLTEVRKTVLASTGNMQRPWSNSSLSTTFYFVPPPSHVIEPAPRPVVGAPDPAAEAWKQVQATADVRQLEQYIAAFPDSPYRTAAEFRLNELRLQPFTVTPEPPTARVRLVGRSEPYQPGMRLPAGNYRVEVRADGYETRMVTVRHDGSLTTHPVALREAQPFTVRTGPPDARVQIVNIEPSYEPGIKLPPGRYDVKVTARGFDTVERALQHGDEPTDVWIGLPFRDCPVCPLMVEIPTGTYTRGRGDEGEGDHNEGPERIVEIRSRIAVGVFEVSFKEWDACRDDNGCQRYLEDGGRGRGQHPVAHATHNDAVEYAKWLCARTGRKYRLLSEAEWEYAARAGTQSDRFWGQGNQCAYANGADVTAQQYNSDWTVANCRDGFTYTAPSSDTRFRPNAWGLYHMLGNVYEWTQDCWHDNYGGAPIDGSAWTKGCHGHLYVARGGSWSAPPIAIRSPWRGHFDPNEPDENVGFRIAVEIAGGVEDHCL